jgi:predicted GTPase
LEENRENIIDLAIHWANERKKPWLKGKKVIALIGEFSAGKTSIVNRILSQDDASAPKLPTNSKATTAIPTYISYGPVFMSQFLDAGGKLKNIKKEDFERVKKDVLGKVNVSSLLDYFVMSYNNPNLKGITILDTPGFSSNDPEDERRTCEVINEADILFWVFDVNQAINKSSITIIKENIKDVPLFIVMNKCDQLSPNEQNAKENNLRETLKKENISIKGVIRFSEKYPIDVIMKAVESIDCKKDNDEVSQILEDLYGLYDTVNQEYKEWLESLSTQKRNLEITEENIQDYFEQYEEDAKIVGEMPQHESHIFSRDCYEISEADYYEFRGRCQRMLDNREPFETEITDLKDFSKNVTEVEEIVSNIKKQRKMLQDYEKKIIDAVKKFDRNYNIPVHVVSSNNEKNQDKTYSSQTKQDNTSSNDSVSSSSSRLRPVKTGMGFVEDLRAFKKKSHEDFLLKSDILYLAKQYGVSETMALTLALNVTNKII